MFSFSRPFAACVFLTLLWVAPAWADTVVVAKRIDMPGVSLQDVRAQLTPGPVPDTVQVTLRAGKADVPGLGWRKVGITLAGNLHRDLQLRWMFDGTVQLNGVPGAALGNATVTVAVDPSANTLEVNADQDATHIGAAFPLDQPTHAQINVRNLPASWLQGLLATVTPGRVTGGKVDADLALDVRDEGFQSSGDATFADLKYATPAGDVSGQGLGGHARFSLDATARPAKLELNGSVRGGELQLGPIVARLPTHDVVMDVGASTEHSVLTVSHLRMDDADALQLEGGMTIDAKGTVQKLHLDRFDAHFPAAYERYGQPWLDNLAGPHLQIAGQLSGHVDYAADALRDFAFHTEKLDIADSSGQLQANGLRGDLDWSVQGEKTSTTLAWNQLVLRQFAFGAEQSRWRSRDGALNLQSPLELPTLKGRTRITKLEWRPAAPKAERLDLAADVQGIDTVALNQVMGWTSFAGTLNGAITSMHWTGDGFALGGALTLKAFDGTALIDHIAVQQPLSSSPAFSGNVTLEQIDLAPLADTFNFGPMSGRLDGTIDNLQLVGGNPVGFKASLLAQNGGRISLRAANNLSIVTGGTAANGLQGAVMKLFKTMNYKRMGIRADLQNGVCTLAGLDGDVSGYSIVEGSGLPYLHVVGAQTRVDWPVLVHRLKAASQSTVADR
ncbi:hypothetical protein [Dyella sp. 2HG41-7]|uniref:hypothetical protein n=1 Tax=Dyella sp. 2HG41-7 TaxID=2883239 RepID=UPI001F465BAF|nr:hypothetical protein [Dyella sp. 2HG41-7]